MTVVEAKYIPCKKLGDEETQVRIRNLLDSGYITVHEDSKLIEYAAKFKCKRRLSLFNSFY
ncbi:MAG: hypothetical protein QXV10_05510 [Nitrososphaerota archaeon]